jgi:hypothetical protein
MNEPPLATACDPTSEVHARANHAGLQRALELFPEDVSAAAATAAQALAILRQLDPPSPADEPWPPMRADAAR